MRTQKKGGAIKELGKGDSDYTAPKIVHWHGAVPGQALIQINPAWLAGLACRMGESRALHGKEGVRGSSPRVGSQEDRPTRASAWPV